MRGTQGERLSPLVVLNMLCLDAPLVAVAWQQLFARSTSVHVSAAASVALFATAWLIYLTDRFADAWTLPSNASASLRQQFARSHQPLLIGAIAVAVMADLIAIPDLNRATLAAGAVVGAVLVVYLALNRFASSIWRIVPVKELAIGVLFAAGVLASLNGAFVVPLNLATMFAALCALNCISIAFWERELDISQKRSSIATTLPMLQRSPLLGCAIVALLALTFSHRPSFICIAISAILLALLNLRNLRIARDTRTALADLVLLTPLIALPFAS